MKSAVLISSFAALGALSFASAAGATVVIPISGTLAVSANVGIGVSNPPDINGNPTPPTVLSSNSDQDSQSWSVVPGGLSASASTSTSYLGDTVTAQGSAIASWASATSGSMTFRDYGWDFNVTNPDNTWSGADVFANRGGPDWSYTFTTTSNSVFSMTYDVTASGFTFGLWGWPINGVSGTGGPVVNAGDPTANGTFVADLTPGTYTVELDSFANIGTGNATFAGSMNGQFDWSIANAGVPEPGTWAMMLIGFGALGAAMRRRSRLVLAA
jgi:hypothetical protein